MAEKVTDQRPVVGDALRPSAIADASSLHDRIVRPHPVSKANKPVIKNRKLFPAERITDFGHRRSSFKLIADFAGTFRFIEIDPERDTDLN